MKNEEETVNADGSAVESETAVDDVSESHGDTAANGVDGASTDSSEASDARAPGADSSSPEREGAAGDGEGDAAVVLAGVRKEFDDLSDKHLRLVAEFNNFRRRSEQERMSAWGRAQADLVGQLLDVLDDLHRVADLDLSNATVETIMEGIDLVERKFMRKLEEAGVEVFEPEGEAFDPERMEAMMRVPAEREEQEDTVAQVFQKGYSLKGTLVRPARVSVYTQG